MFTCFIVTNSSGVIRCYLIQNPQGQQTIWIYSAYNPRQLVVRLQYVIDAMAAPTRFIMPTLYSTNLIRQGGGSVWSYYTIGIVTATVT